MADALDEQPHLRLEDDGNRLVLRGQFDIREADELIEAFGVEVVPASDSPCGLPTVWEVGGRIPRVSDPHHVNEEDGSLCVVLPEAFWYTYPRGLSLAEYLDGPLRRHLAAQAMVLRGEEWPSGEWYHGYNGVLQFYGEVFSAQTEPQRQGFLDLVTRERVKGHWECPCGSGRRLRACHQDQVYRVREHVPHHLRARVRQHMAAVGRKHHE